MRWNEPIKNWEGVQVIEGVGAEESGAEIHILENGTFDLYEIPQYGGEPQYNDNYPTIEAAKEVAESWT